MLCTQLSYLVCAEGVEGGGDVRYRLKGIWQRLFLGWGGERIQPQGALTWLAWLAANIADSGGRGAVYYLRWGGEWGGACDVMFHCFSPWDFFFAAD